jgi:hypothetical protein
MMKLAQVLVVALFLALTLSACEDDEPGSSPDTAVLFGLNTPYNIGLGGVHDYYAYFRASTTSHTVNLTGLTADFGLFSYGTDSTYSGSGTECNNNPGDNTSEACVIGPTTGNYYYYIRIRNYTAAHGVATVTIN